MKIFFNKLLGNTTLHFFLLGALAFWLYSRMSLPEKDFQTIHITDTYVKILADRFQQKNLRPPSSKELDLIIHQEVEEEVLYREAVKRNLDQGDEFIRMRMIKKMDFLIEGMADVPQPGKNQLQEYLDSHSEQFMEREKTSFRHIFFDPSKRAGQTREEALSALSGLKKENISLQDSYKMGDFFLGGYEFVLANEKKVAGVFGKEFAKALKSIGPASHWYGPVFSRYGEHFVYIYERQGARIPPLTKIYKEVYRAWKDTQKMQREKSVKKDLKATYKVVISKEDPPGGRVK